MQVATRFERRQNNAKNDNVILQSTNVQCILKALNKLLQLGNMA